MMKRRSLHLHDFPRLIIFAACQVALSPFYNAPGLSWGLFISLVRLHNLIRGRMPMDEEVMQA